MPLGVALPYKEDDGRGVGRALFGKRLCQLGTTSPLSARGVDVVAQSQGDHIGFQAIPHRPCLLAGTAVGLPDLHHLSGLALQCRAELKSLRNSRVES